MSKGFHRLPSATPWSNRAMDGLLTAPAGVFQPTPPAHGAGPLGPRTDLAEFEPGPTKMDRATARDQGYTGDSCSNCQSMRMQIAGHCMVCAECGTTTGCS